MTDQTITEGDATPSRERLLDLPLRERLLDAALLTVRELGIAGVSARTVAARAGCNQAAIYYHYGSLTALLGAACHHATAARVEVWRPRLDAVDSVEALVALARRLHAEEHELGNVQVLAQMLAGAQADPALTTPTADALELWTAEIERTLRRLLDGTVLDTMVDVSALGRAVSAAFVGIELVDGLGDPNGTVLPTLDAVEELGALLQVVLDLGPMAAATLRRRVRRARP